MGSELSAPKFRRLGTHKVSTWKTAIWDDPVSVVQLQPLSVLVASRYGEPLVPIIRLQHLSPGGPLGYGWRLLLQRARAVCALCGVSWGAVEGIER